MLIILIVKCCLLSTMNFLLFSIVAATANITIERYRHISISVIGGVVLSFCGLIYLPKLCFLFLVLTTYTSSIIILYYPITLQKTLLLELILLTYILLVWAIRYLTQLIYYTVFRLSAFSYVVLNIIEYLIIFLFLLIIYVFFKVIYRKKYINSFVYVVSLEIGNRNLKFKMFLDSGNSLYDDNKTGLPVIIISNDALKKQFNGDVMNYIDREIVYKNLNGQNSKIRVMGPKIIVVQNNNMIKKFDVIVGVVEENFKSFDGLLHSSVCF